MTITTKPTAICYLARAESPDDRVTRALLSNIDGHRTVIELERFARAMGLEPRTLEHLRLRGLVYLAT
jgi:hypothetical protein